MIIIERLTHFRSPLFGVSNFMGADVHLGFSRPLSHSLVKKEKPTESGRLS